MPRFATQATDSTSPAGGSSAPDGPPFGLGSAGAAVDGRSRAPEAARPQGGRASAFGRTSTEVPSFNPATAGGLVICAKNVRESVDEIATGELQAIDALGLRFPSPEMVRAAAALFEPAAPWAPGRGRRGTEPESGRFRITVGPGVVRLGWTNPVRAERAAERAVGHHQRDVDDEKLRVKADLEREAEHSDQAVASLTRRSPTDSDERSTGGRNCQYLWIGLFQATSVPVDSVGAESADGVMSVGRSSSLPLWKIAPARTRATRCGALTARQRACAASISL